MLNRFFTGVLIALSGFIVLFSLFIMSRVDTSGKIRFTYVTTEYNIERVIPKHCNRYYLVSGYDRSFEGFIRQIREYNIESHTQDSIKTMVDKYGFFNQVFHRETLWDTHKYGMTTLDYYPLFFEALFYPNWTLRETELLTVSWQRKEGVIIPYVSVLHAVFGKYFPDEYYPTEEPIYINAIKILQGEE